MDVGAPRHPGVRHLGRDRAPPPTRPRAAARAGWPRARPPRPPAAGRPRRRRAGARSCRRPRTAPGRTTDAGPSRSQCSDSSPSQQGPVHRGRPAQQVMAEPQVVAARDADPGRQQGRVPPRRVVPHPARPVGLALPHVRRQVGQRQLEALVAVRHQHALARQARERDAGHGTTLAPRGDSHFRCGQTAVTCPPFSGRERWLPHRPKGRGVSGRPGAAGRPASDPRPRGSSSSIVTGACALRTLPADVDRHDVRAVARGH